MINCACKHWDADECFKTRHPELTTFHEPCDCACHREIKGWEDEETEDHWRRAVTEIQKGEWDGD
jgi:hypothetical protein